MKDDNSSLFESIEKANDIYKKMEGVVAPLIESQEKINTLSDTLLSSVYRFSSMVYINPAIEAMRQAIENTMLEKIQFQFISPMAELVRGMSKAMESSLANTLRSILNNQNAFVNTFETPAMKWLSGFDFTPLLEAFKRIQFPDISQRFKEIREIYLRTMYETKWFPYVGWFARVSLLRDIGNIINTSRTGSKNREKRIDKAIFSYYNDTEIRSIKKRWWKADLDYCVRKMLGQAIEAYFRREYALTISALATMWV